MSDVVPMSASDADPVLFDALERQSAPSDAQSGPDDTYERHLHREGALHVAGTDEAGRGPLAGPVVAAAVILPRDLSGSARSDLALLDDSKKLTKAKREFLFDAIHRHADAVSICSTSAETIDSSNILRASLDAMQTAVAALSLPVDGLLVDGNRAPDGLPIYMRVRTIVGGDGLSQSIAAASVIAKVTRDRMMARLGSEHADYALERHAGYGSLAHRNAIMAHGGVPRVHRFSFKPLRMDDDLLTSETKKPVR